MWNIQILSKSYYFILYMKFCGTETVSNKETTINHLKGLCHVLGRNLVYLIIC